MFGKSKVSQAVLDAVNSVLEVKVEEKSTSQPSDNQRVPMAPAGTPVNLSETAAIKEPTKTGMKVYGGSYGNSAKAKKDQTKSPVDNLKGPKDKDMARALVKQDIAVSRIERQAKKKVKEGMEFAAKLLETVRKSDVPAYLRKAKGDTPLTVADVKGPKKDSISAPENLAKARNEEVVTEAKGIEVKKEYDDKKEAEHGVYHNGQKIGYVVHNKKHGVHTAYHSPQGDKDDEDYGQIDDFHSHHDAVSQIRHSAGVSMREEVEIDEATAGAQAMKASGVKQSPDKLLARTGMNMAHRFPRPGQTNLGNIPGMNTPNVSKDTADYAEKRRGDRAKDLKPAIKAALGTHGPKGNLPEEVEQVNEKESYEPSDAPITTDTLAGRLPGGKSNGFKSFKTRVKPLAKETGETETPDAKEPEKTRARASIKAEGVEVDEATIAGTPGWKKTPKNVTDKSGAVHTPMSRAKSLARDAFKVVQDKTKIK